MRNSYFLAVLIALILVAISALSAVILLSSINTATAPSQTPEIKPTVIEIEPIEKPDRSKFRVKAGRL